MAPADIALALATAVVWGLTFIAMKIGLQEAPPFLLTALRFLLAAVPAVLLLRRPQTPLKILVSYGLFVGVAQFGLLFLAIRLGMPAGLASLLMQLQAFITVGLAWIFLSERPTRPQLIASAIALAGVAAIASARLGGAETLPFALTIVASACWASANLIGKMAGKVDPLAFVVWSSLVAPLPMLALSLSFEGPAVGRTLAHPTLSLAASVLILAWGGTLFGFGVWSRLLMRYPAAVVGPFSLLVPVVGMAAAWIVFGETPRPIEWIGAFLIMAALGFHVLGARLSMPGRRR